MATNVATLTAKLTADTSGLKRGLSSAERDVQGFAGRSGQAFATVGKVAAAGAAAGAAAIGAMAVKSVSAFADFERGMNEVFTLLPDASEQAMGEMEADVKSLATEFGVLPDKVVPALYQALSAGVPQDSVFEFMETATKASIAGVTELETAVDGLSSVVNAYGEDTIDAAEASDLMFTAVRLGKTTMDELARSLFQVNPVAAALGVEFSDVTAALAAMTAQGTPTRVATTQLRQALVELGKEGSEAFTTFQTATGQTFPDFIKGGGDVEEAFQAMKTQADRMGVGVGDLFGSVEAGMGVIALTSESGAEAFSTAMDEMTDSAGATETAFGTMDQGLSRAFDRIKATLSTAFIDAGERLAPFIEQFSEWFADTLPGAIDKTMTAMDSVIGLGQNFGAGMSAVYDWFKSLPDVAETAIVAIGGVTLALTALWGHPVAAAFGAVTAAIILVGDVARDAEGEIAAIRSTVEEFGDAAEGIALVDMINDSELLTTYMDDLGVSVGQVTKAMEDGPQGIAKFLSGLRDITSGHDAEMKIQAIGKKLEEFYDRLAAVRIAIEEETAAALRMGNAQELSDKKIQGAIRTQNALSYAVEDVTSDIDDLGDGLEDSVEDFVDWEKELRASQRAVEREFRESVNGMVSVWKKAPKQIEVSVDEMIAILLETSTAAANYETVMAELAGRGLYALMGQLEEAGPQYTLAFQNLLDDATAAATLDLDLQAMIIAAASGMSVSQVTAEINGFLSRVSAGLTLTVPTPSVPSPPSSDPRSKKPVGMRASGGPVSAGDPYVVGEKGPELFVPQQSGAIVPNSQTAGGRTINFYIDKIDTDYDPDIAEELVKASITEQVDLIGAW